MYSAQCSDFFNLFCGLLKIVTNARNYVNRSAQITRNTMLVIISGN